MARSRSALPAVLALAVVLSLGLHAAFVAAPSRQRAAATLDEPAEAPRRLVAQEALSVEASWASPPSFLTEEDVAHAQASWASPPPYLRKSSEKDEVAAARVGLGISVALFALVASFGVDVATVVAEQLRRTFRAPQSVEELGQVVGYVENTLVRDLNYYVTNPSALFNDLVGYGDIRLGIQCLTGQLFNFAPMTAMKTIMAEGSTGQAPMLPYSAMLAQGVIWGMYGLLLHNPAIWVPNIPTILLGVAYTAIFWNNCPKDADSLPSTKPMHLAGIAASVAVSGGLALALPAAQAASVLGILGVVASIVTFAGPLTALKGVMETKNTATLNFELAVATVINCALWLYYGTVMLSDPCIWFPNVLGLASGGAQLALFARYGFGPQEASAEQDFALEARAADQEELAV